MCLIPQRALKFMFYNVKVRSNRSKDHYFSIVLDANSET